MPNPVQIRGKFPAASAAGKGMWRSFMADISSTLPTTRQIDIDAMTTTTKTPILSSLTSITRLKKKTKMMVISESWPPWSWQFLAHTQHANYQNIYSLALDKLRISLPLHSRTKLASRPHYHTTILILPSTWTSHICQCTPKQLETKAGIPADVSDVIHSPSPNKNLHPVLAFIILSRLLW